MHPLLTRGPGTTPRRLKPISRVYAARDPQLGGSGRGDQRFEPLPDDTAKKHWLGVTPE